MIFLIILYYVSIKIKNQTAFSILLFLTLFIQLADIRPIFIPWKTKVENYSHPLNHPEWDKILLHVDKMILYPPMRRSFVGFTDDYRYFAILAAKHKLPFTAGYVSRTDSAAACNYKKKLHENLIKGIVDVNAVYITTQQHLENFGYVIENNVANCAVINDYFVFLSKSNPYHLDENLVIDTAKIRQVVDNERTYKKTKLNHYIELIKTDKNFMSQVETEADEKNKPIDDLLKQKANKLMRADYRAKRIKYYEESIRGSAEWLWAIKEKAIAHGIELDDMINTDAIFMFDQERISSYDKLIRNSEEYLKLVKEKAEKQKIDLDEMIKREATYMYEQQEKKLQAE